MKEVHSTYFKIRHRVTGLFLSNASSPNEWSGRGKLFKNKKSLHNKLRALKEIPREWEIVPIELVVRDDLRMNARSYLAVWKNSLKGRKK